MKIAFLCKRRYTGSDVVLDRFGRLYEIPLQLARMGHDVRGYCLDYHQPGSGEWEHEASGGSLAWESRSLGTLRAPAALRYPWDLLLRLRHFSPHLLIGASDIPHVVMTAWLARRIRTPYAVDLYDNFESFSLARIPGFVGAYRRAIRGAGLVTVVSEPLGQMAEMKYSPRGPIRVLTNAIDGTVFRRSNGCLARQRFGLPFDAKLIGTAGGLYRSKGLIPLYLGWKQLAEARPDVHLVLAGPTEKDLPLPRGERVHYLGHLPQTGVADLFNALDVGVITLLDSAFGRYCFPQKLQEMLACGLPVVAADVGAMSIVLKDVPQLLYPAQDASALAAAVLRQLDNPVVPAVSLTDWKQIVESIEPDLQELATGGAS